MEISEAITHLRRGSAILLVGAGFNRGVLDSNGDPMPSTDGLRDELLEHLGDENLTKNKPPLSTAAEYVINHDSSSVPLLNLLRHRLAASFVPDEQRRCLEQDWRSIYTTNYDDVIEFVDKGQRFSPLSSQSNQSELKKSKRVLLYLHGRIRDLVDKVSPPDIVLSSSSYVTASGGDNYWLNVFENDIYNSTTIFIVANSLNDHHISALFANRPSIQEKTHIITGPDQNSHEVKRLEKFGTVHTIGIDGLARLLHETPFEADIDYKVSFLQPQRRPEATPYGFDEVQNLVVYGQFDNANYLHQFNRRDAKDRHELYCVDRVAQLESLEQAVSGGIRRFIVHSDLGNGKTNFLQQAEPRLQRSGFEVYWINNNLPEILTDIQRIIESGRQAAFILDGFSRYKRFIDYIALHMSANNILIVTLQTATYIANKGVILRSIGGASRELDVNRLSESEISSWDKYLEGYGLWGQSWRDDEAGRIRHLRAECKSEVRSVILSLYRDKSAISEKIYRAVEYFQNRHRDQKTAFYALLFSALSSGVIHHERAIAWAGARPDALQRAIAEGGIDGLFESGSKWHSFSSTVLAGHILEHMIDDPELLVDVCFRIIREMYYASKDDRGGGAAREDAIEVMRFPFMKRVFGNSQASYERIKALYERLRAGVKPIRENYAFWVQYAMSRRECHDFEGAEQHLEQAYGKLRPSQINERLQIDDQRVKVMLDARIYSDRYNDFNSAAKEVAKLIDEIVLAEGDKIHVLRSSVNIHRFLDKRIEKLQRSTLDVLLATIKKLEAILGDQRDLKTNQHEIRQITLALDGSHLLIQNA